MSEVAVNLKKGENVNLTKTNPGLNKVLVGLGWDVNSNGPKFDLDAFAYLLKGGKASADHLIYFNNLSGFGLTHSGDNRDGLGDGDDEAISIDLSAVPADIDTIAIGVNIYEAKKDNLNFGQVNNSFVRLVNPDNGNEELLKYELGEDHSASTGFILGELYRKNGEWKFKAVGLPVNGDIVEIGKAQNYF